MSPFQALYGVPPPLIHSYILGSTAVNQVDLLLQDRDALLSTLKENL